MAVMTWTAAQQQVGAVENVATISQPWQRAALLDLLTTAGALARLHRSRTLARLASPTGKGPARPEQRWHQHLRPHRRCLHELFQIRALSDHWQPGSLRRRGLAAIAQPPPRQSLRAALPWILEKKRQSGKSPAPALAGLKPRSTSQFEKWPAVLHRKSGRRRNQSCCRWRHRHMKPHQVFSVARLAMKRAEPLAAWARPGARARNARRPRPPGGCGRGRCVAAVDPCQRAKRRGANTRQGMAHGRPPNGATGARRPCRQGGAGAGSIGRANAAPS